VDVHRDLPARHGPNPGHHLRVLWQGATQTASLMVTPATPPPPTLSSLTLNPTSVNGGSPLHRPASR